MSLFNDEDNCLLEDDLSPLQNFNDKFVYNNILGEKLSVEIGNDNEKLFDVLRRELSKWLVCDRLVCDKCGKIILFECGKINPQEYEKGVYRYGQYSPSQKKITLDDTHIPNDEEEATEIKASTILHELMHAYFDCGLSVKPNIELIEEPLAEAGMLDFLSHCNGMSFNKVLQRVAEKEKTSCIAHYGFGAYIHQQSKDEVGTLYELYYKILHKGCCIDVNKFIEGLNEYGEYKKIICKRSQDDKKYELLRAILKKAEEQTNIQRV